MTGVLLDPSRVDPSPWRNGAGTTRELAAATDPAGELLWRISVADLDRGSAFSTFPDTDRLFVALGPLRLTVDGADRVLQAGDQMRFDGEAAVTATVAAPTRALNVMTRRGRFHAEVTLHTRGSAAESPEVVTVDLGDRTAEVRLVPLDPAAKDPDA